MQKSYTEIVSTCEAFSYAEGPIMRVEVYLDTDRSWECKWFYSNDQYLPNTITYKFYE